MARPKENVSDSLNQFLNQNDETGTQSLIVREGMYRSWVPRILYTMPLYELHLPFLRLFSFPVGGCAIGCLATNLTIFKATGNYLDNLPSCFADCKHLTFLDLSFNQLVTLPLPVFKLTKLEDLNVEHNYITTLDSSIGHLKNLRCLNLRGNLLSELPGEIRKCRDMRRLYLAGKFYPRGKFHRFPESICHLTKLIELDLSWQQICNIPPSFGKLKHLEVLSLKWNQLQNVSPDLGKCSKLRVIDLSGALRLLSTIPEALFSLEDLHSLNISDNFFTEIPEQVIGLVKLRCLVIQRNSLLRLQSDLFKLRYLEHLELSENFLESLPEGIKCLKRLHYLGLDNNKLTYLPDEICSLENLQYLSVSRNKLQELPEKIYELRRLRWLNVDSNELREIPLLMDRLQILAQLNSFSILNNNLRSPFKEMSEQGTTELFSFLKAIRLKEAKHRWKMILIGAAKAGKTSLRQALMLGHSKLAAEADRTWVMERHLWEPESRLRVQILDFGGHHIYQAAHHMFLSSDALHVLVFDLTKYCTESFYDLIGHWLDAIMDKAAGASIVIVGTHCDLCSSEDIEEKKEDILRLIKRDETMKVNQIKREIQMVTEELDRPEVRRISKGIPEIDVGRLQEKLNRLQKMLNLRSKVPDKIHIVSCADGLFGVEDLRSNLIQRIKEVPVTALPDPWFKFLEQIQRLPSRVVSLEEAKANFSQIMTESQQSMMAMGGSPDRSLEMVLKYFHSTGEIVWYHDNEQLRSTIFHHPETLINMLRAVFRHDFDEVVHFVEETGQFAGLSEKQFDKMKKNFLNKGLLTRELLKYLLLHFQLTDEASDSLLMLISSLMLKFDLCFELKGSVTEALIGSTNIMQFPWFFAQEEPEELALKWRPNLPQNTFELCMELSFFGLSPPNFFEKLSVKLHTFLSDTERLNWKDGVFALKNSSSLLVRRGMTDTGSLIVVSARGSYDLQELWGLIKDVRVSALTLFHDWPLLKCEINLVCTHCLLKRVEDPSHYPGLVLERALPRDLHLKCCDKFPDDLIPTCFVFPMEEANYQDHHQDHMRAATDFMMSLAEAVDVVDGDVPSLLSDSGLAVIASNLGINWNLVALQLGLPQVRIEQIQMSYPQDVYRQIINALIEWRESGLRSKDPSSLVQDLFDILAREEIGRNDLVQKLQNDYMIS